MGVYGEGVGVSGVCSLILTLQFIAGSLEGIPFSSAYTLNFSIYI